MSALDFNTLGAPSPVHGFLRCDSVLLVLDFLHTESMLLVRSLIRSGFVTTSLDSHNLGPSLSLQSPSHPESFTLPLGVARFGVSASALGALYVDSFVSLHHNMRFGPSMSMPAESLLEPFLSTRSSA